MQSCKQKVTSQNKNFSRGKLGRKSVSRNTKQKKARGLNGDNIYQQDQQVRKRSHHHLQEIPRVIVRHSTEHPAISVLDTQNKFVPVPRVEQHKVTNTLQNQNIIPHKFVCNTESNDNISKMIHQLVKKQSASIMDIKKFDVTVYIL